MTRLCFVDIETTGTDPDRHDVWEVAVIARAGSTESERTWLLEPDLAVADSSALRVNRFYERSGKPGPWDWADPADAASDIASMTAGAVIVAANPAFDTGFLGDFLRANGQCPAWDYHLTDLGSLVLGWAHGRHKAPQDAPPLKLSRAAAIVGVDPDKYDTHTALGDARLARDIYDAVTGHA